jgi:flavin-dependent dehydrogenase
VALRRIRRIDIDVPLFEDESGWAWFIPLQDKTVSVGIVMDSKVSAAKKAAGSAAAGDGKVHSLEDHYLSQLAFVPKLKKLLGGAKLRVDVNGQIPTVKSASDFSYTASQYSGDHFRLVGDASAFVSNNAPHPDLFESKNMRLKQIDPFFSLAHLSTYRINRLNN